MGFYLLALKGAVYGLGVIRLFFATMLLCLCPLAAAGDDAGAVDLDNPEVLKEVIAQALPDTKIMTIINDAYDLKGAKPITAWVKSTYRNGQTAWLYYYAEGKLEGVSIGWHENGKLSFKNHHKAGVRDGVWSSWTAEDGGLALRQVYEDGKCIKTEEWPGVL